MNKYIMELIGTFFLVLVIGLVVTEPGAGNLAPLAIGSVLMVMVYAGGHISGAHYNPAVTIAAWVRGAIQVKDVIFYIAFQVIGALLASQLVGYLKSTDVNGPMTIVTKQAFIAELLFTFALAFVVLNVATAKRTEGNSNYGLAIGFTVMVAAFAIGNISGCAINPAVTIGLVLMGLIKGASVATYFAAQLFGGALAGIVFKAINK